MVDTILREVWTSCSVWPELLSPRKTCGFWQNKRSNWSYSSSLLGIKGALGHIFI